jgi:hypothetical protein
MIAMALFVQCPARQRSRSAIAARLVLGRYDADLRWWVAVAEETELRADRSGGGWRPPSPFTLDAGLSEAIKNRVEGWSRHGGVW